MIESNSSPKATADYFGQLYVTASSENDFKNAKTIAREAVTHLKQCLNRKYEVETAEEQAALFHTAMFFRLLFDYAELRHVIQKPKWEQKPKSLEKVWRIMCDCEDRLNYLQKYISGGMMQQISRTIQNLEEFYFANFGSGLYSSPELLVKREECSICGRDSRECDHIPGRVYEGRLCVSLARDAEMVSSSIVQVPHDLRCRIWPWQIKGNKVSSIILLSVFQLDDFMKSDDWK